MIFHPASDRGDLDEVDTRIEKHERVHTFQLQDMMVLSLVLGLIDLAVTGDPWYALAKWWAGGLFQLPNFLTSVLRHGAKAHRVDDLRKSWLKRLKENAYRQSEHERSAYAQTDMITQLGSRTVSWRELQDLWKEDQKGHVEDWKLDNP